MEYLHFLLYLRIVLGIVDTGLHQIVEVDLRKGLVGSILWHTNAKQTEQDSRQEGSETGDGPQHHITNPSGNGKDGEHGRL